MPVRFDCSTSWFRTRQAGAGFWNNLWDRHITYSSAPNRWGSGSTWMGAAPRKRNSAFQGGAARLFHTVQSVMTLPIHRSQFSASNPNKRLTNRMADTNAHQISLEVWHTSQTLGKVHQAGRKIV
jgi:hypothetical protein